MPSAAIAYFSMEIALHPRMPTYSGGLGMLAGDTVRSAADLKVPMVAVTLLHRKGYFDQTLDAQGRQSETPANWNPPEYCRELEPRVAVSVEGRSVTLRAWQFDVVGVTGFAVPALLLDADLSENTAWDRTVTDSLYGDGAHYRLCQEVVLGMGGVRMLRALGYHDVRRFHMNEGHAALLALELLDERARQHGRAAFDGDDVQAVRRQCVFTTHTPVPAGHDRFALDHASRVLGRSDVFERRDVFCCAGELNMTYLALNLSHYVNGVARRHGEVSREILVPRDREHHYRIDSITNGIHLATWAAPAFADLFDRHIPAWREDNSSLRNALRIPLPEIARAHAAAKEALFAEIKRRTGVGWDVNALTLGFARRATAYKRPTLLLSDPARLRQAGAGTGRLQIVFGGKAHPQDEAGKRLIREVVGKRGLFRPEVEIVYLENYDWALARLVVAGVDVWLNTPQPPLEASGTSGMKAALNGVPSLSVLDGWWLEGCIEGVTGWAFGDSASDAPGATDRAEADAASLYHKLEGVIVPCFYNERDRFDRISRDAIALNASHFNTHRMLQEYLLKAYFG